MRLSSLPLCVLLSLPLFAGCQKSGDAAVEAGAERMAGREVDVKSGKDQVTINAKDAQLQIARDGQGLALPADFPKDVYLPDDFVVGNVLTVPRMLTVSGVTQGNLDDVFAQARASMQQHGWLEKSASQRPQMQTLALKKEDREAVLNLIERDGRVMVSYSLRTPPKR